MPHKHPAAHLLRALLIREPNITDAQLQKQLEDWGMLTADPTLFPIMRAELPERPQGFDPADRLNRPSVRYLRDLQIYEFFHPNDAMHAAMELLGDPEKRQVVEQILLSRLNLKEACKRVNTKQNWQLSEDGVKMYQHYFWNVPSMTFDEWGRFLQGRTAWYQRYLTLLTAPPKLSFMLLRLDQQIDSKKMIQDVQFIAYKTLLEVDEQPGIQIDKVKSINLLGKIVLEAHAALSTSDMALKDTLKQFEQWRMEHPESLPPALKQLAPAGNFTGSGANGTKKNGANGSTN